MALVAPVGRTQGYEAARGLEQGGLAWAERFLREVAGLSMYRVRDRDDNYRHGDLASLSGRTVEVKRQPVDPGQYPENFVEVFEVTGNPAHAGGLATTAALLRLDLPRLAGARVRTRTGIETVGYPDLVSASLTSVAGSAITLYVNPGAWVYAYDSAVLLGDVRDAVLGRGFRLGAGRSNGSTYAVHVPVPPCVWAWRGAWVYAGRGSADLAAAGLVHRLS